MIIINCGGTKPPTTTPPATTEIIKGIPDDIVNHPKSDSNYVYEFGTATSKDMGAARDKALLNAEVALQRSIEVRLKGIGKRFQEEVGDQYNDVFVQASEYVVSTVLNFAFTENTKFMNEKGVFRAYVLKKLAIGRMNKALMDKISENQRMLNMYKATETWKELDTKTKEFDNERKTQ